MPRWETVKLEDATPRRARVQAEIEQYMQQFQDLPKLHERGETKALVLDPGERPGIVRARIRQAARALQLRVRIVRKGDNRFVVRLVG